MSGQLVQTLADGTIQAQGFYEYTFEPSDNTDNIYFAILTTPEKVLTKKLIFIR